MASRDLAVVLLLGLIGGHTSQPPPACAGLFVAAAPGTALDISGPTVKDLTSELQSRGFCVERSPHDADAVIELLGRRQLPKRVRSIANRFTYVNLIRLEAAAGDVTEELRVYGEGTSPEIAALSAIDLAARDVERWVKAHRVGTGRAAVTREEPADTVALDTLLTRARQYVTDYETQFATIIGEERYRQDFAQERTIDSQVGVVNMTKISRSTRSEVSLAWFSDVPGWFGFRDVIDVDGKPVKDRDRRLARLFLEKPSGKLLKQALQESARYNLGTIRRNFNVPMVTLQFLEEDLSRRFRFEDGGHGRAGDRPAQIVRFQEMARPTIILSSEVDAPASGRYWIDADTGRVLKTELVIGDRNGDIRISTWYRPDERLGIWVPARMTERYDYINRLYDSIQCEASYANFRRFETGARIVLPK
jgi:hypothetical protein